MFLEIFEGSKNIYIYINCDTTSRNFLSFLYFLTQPQCDNKANIRKTPRGSVLSDQKLFK